MMSYLEPMLLASDRRRAPFPGSTQWYDQQHEHSRRKLQAAPGDEGGLFVKWYEPTVSALAAARGTLEMSPQSRFVNFADALYLSLRPGEGTSSSSSLRITPVWLEKQFLLGKDDEAVKFAPATEVSSSSGQTASQSPWAQLQNNWDCIKYLFSAPVPVHASTRHLDAPPADHVSSAADQTSSFRNTCKDSAFNDKLIPRQFREYQYSYFRAQTRDPPRGALMRNPDAKTTLQEMLRGAFGFA
ncbi:unnamed protein product [Amoebophrya sp. A25]|nr:unnamed protein product [Amoebophrya sp. A25]|eukprot:GSA25T00026068001.1